MLASTAYAVRVGKSSLTFSGPIARRKSAATECVLSGNTSSIMPPPCSRPVGHSEDVAKALQRRSRIAQGLNVQKESTPWPFTRCGLAGRAFSASSGFHTAPSRHPEGNYMVHGLRGLCNSLILVGDRPVGQGADTGTAREPDGVRLMRRLKGAKRPGLPRPVRTPAPTRPVL